MVSADWARGDTRSIAELKRYVSLADLEGAVGSAPRAAGPPVVCHARLLKEALGQRPPKNLAWGFSVTCPLSTQGRACGCTAQAGRTQPVNVGGRQVDATFDRDLSTGLVEIGGHKVVCDGHDVG
jgi:hypothetical protein